MGLSVGATLVVARSKERSNLLGVFSLDTADSLRCRLRATTRVAPTEHLFAVASGRQLIASQRCPGTGGAALSAPGDHQGRPYGTGLLTVFLCSFSAAAFNLRSESATPDSNKRAPRCSISQPRQPGGKVKSQPNWTRHDCPSMGAQVMVVYSLIPIGCVTSICI